MKQDQEKIDALNAALKALDGMEPFVQFEDVGKQVTPEMREGLAQAYAIKGFRDLLAYKYNRAVKLTALTSTTIVDQAAGKARALTYKEILRDGLQAYGELARIKALKKKTNGK